MPVVSRQQASFPVPDSPAKADFFGYVQIPASQPIAVPALAKADARISLKPKRGLFRAMELRTNVAVDAGKWRDYMRRVAHDAVDEDACGPGCSRAYRTWRAMIDELRGADPWIQLIEVNRRINRLVRYNSDQHRFGEADHWATPREFLTRRGGDCEDFALLKYVSLRELGFADRRMRLVVVRDTGRRQNHAVLSVSMPEGREILDSLDPAPRRHSTLTQYVPRYSINGSGAWIHVRPERLPRHALRPASGGN